MLSFLRKHQKVIFGLITFMVIASFSFFGTYGAIEKTEKIQSRVVGKSLDGKEVYSRPLEVLIHLIDTDVVDALAGERGAMPNLLNDGVVRRDVLETGLGEIIFEMYLDGLKGEFLEKVSEFHKFRPYEHPQKMIGVETIWKHFLPHFYADYHSFQKMSGEDVLGSFKGLIKLYRHQETYSPEMMRQMLLYQQHQYSNWLQPDPYLQNGDLSLFRAKSIKEWFGNRFLESVAHVIYNGAIFAEKQGYKVSFEEARAHLMQTSIKNVRKLDPNRGFSAAELDQIYHSQLRQQGILEKEAVEAWQKVLLFRRVLDDVGCGVLVDSLLYKQFHDKASKGSKVELYRPVKELSIESLDDVLSLEMYLANVARETQLISGLPREFLSVKEVMQKAPELVEKRFLIRLVKVEKEKLENEIGLKKMLDWQLVDEHWKHLALQFEELNLCKGIDRESRFLFLGTLSDELKEKIGAFSRREMLKAEPEFIKERLSSMVTQVQKLDIALEGEEEVLAGIPDRRALLDLLEKGAILGSESLESADIAEKLSCYSQDGKTYYRIRIVDRSDLYEVMSFLEAKQKGVLQSLVGKKLREEYQLLGSSGKFDEMQEMLKKSLLRKLSLPLHKISLEESDDAICKEFKEKRLTPFMRQMQRRAKDGEAIISKKHEIVAKDKLEIADPLEAQWRVEKEELTILRKMANPLFDESFFHKKEGEWSLVESVDSSAPVFYKVGEPVFDEHAISKGMQEARCILGNEAKKHFLKKLLMEMKGLTPVYINGSEELSTH